MKKRRYHYIVAPALGALAIGLNASVQAGQLERVKPIEPTRDERQILSDSETEVSQIGHKALTFGNKTGASIPSDFAPWWIRGQHNTLGSGDHAQAVTLDDLYVRALRHSHQIRVFADLPLIRETGIQEAAGAFDTNAYLEGKFDRTNDPVGNTLTTGSLDRFKQDEWTIEAGLKKKLITGAEVDLSQDLNRIKNNSIYFVPNPQAKSTLSLSVTQPLLKGAGVAYNRTIMQVARLDSEVAMQEFVRQSESHLLEICRSYWALYAARVMYLQKARLVDDTARVTDELKARQKVDAQKSQLFRAESALADRRSSLVRAEAAVRNAQDKLKSLTNDPALLSSSGAEIIPTDRLLLSSQGVDAEHAAQVALKSRPEINQAFLQLRAATLRENMSRNELMPELNVVLQGSLGGLSDGEYDDAYDRSYHTGSPGWGAGLVLSFPLENNIARSHHERRQIETRQQIAQLKTTIDTVLLEVKISAREVATSWREMQSKYAAVTAYTEDIETLQARRPLKAVDDDMQMAVYLDTLLDSQDRRSRAEEEFIQAAADYQIAMVNLERSKGNLLAYKDVNIVRDVDTNKVPILYLEKGQHSAKGSVGK